MDGYIRCGNYSCPYNDLAVCTAEMGGCPCDEEDE